MKTMKLFLILPLFMLAVELKAQEYDPVTTIPDKVAIGLGRGFDFGGYGANLTVYINKNLGLFAGGGYANVGFGFNGGAKVRFIPYKPNYKLNSFLLLMYGYNSAIAVSEAKEFNKLFYGPTIGLGIDYRPRPYMKRGYFSLAILVPFRGSDVNDYMDDLEANEGIKFESGLFPVSFSLGYKFILK